ncbi:TonB-dependent receptor [Sphingomonas sp. MG17]|uniref:TonB-dependent receptor n=1 Tax=Sphingomonas tagetis TaxID=2949092 RepID=A0A9X2HHD0_9SPHN|nr:TonB-dependent receptor [Sphingomonas tagetis]
MTAVTADTLAQAGAVKTSDIAALVPGLVFTNTLGGGVPYIRGIGQTLGVPGAESPVGLYIDGVYLLTPASGLFEFNNIDRVEVLRGPQGTLFGRNTTGGLINIITRDPGDSFQLDADVGVGNYKSFSAHLFAATPVGGGLSTSVSAFGFRRKDGFGRNVTLNIDLFRETSWGIQNKWRWLSEDGATDVVLNLLHSYSKSQVGMTYGVPPGSIGGDGSRYLGQYVFASSVHEPAVNRQNLASLKISHDFGSFQVMNIAAYHTLYQKYRFAQLGYDNNALAATNPFAAQYPNLIAKDNTFTEEFQIQAPAGAKFQWIVGAYYMHDDIPMFHTESKPNNVLRINIDTRQKTDSYAGFVQGTYPILENTRLTAGLRYTSETKRIAGQAALANGTIISTPANPGPGQAPLAPETTWSKLTYRASLDHDFSDDVMGYASYNRGFKGGVYNLANYGNPPAEPEIVDAYEVGLKTYLFDRRARFNISAFYYDYKDIQLRTSITTNTGTFFATYNAATARMKGIDVDFEVRPLDGLNLTGGFEILDAEYRSFPRGLYAFPNPLTPASLPANCNPPAAYNPAPGGNTTLTCNLSGNRMIRAPKLTFNLGMSYKARLADGGALLFTANDAYNSGFFWDPENRLRQNSYHNISAAITYTTPDGKWDLQLWGRNLADEWIWSTATGGTSDTYSPGLPRTFGVRVGLHL